MLQIIDVDRYNLLQKAIIWDRLDLVTLLVERGYDCNGVPMVARHHKSLLLREENDRPLHLACFLGKKICWKGKLSLLLISLNHHP